MAYVWTVGLVVPLLMIFTALTASATRHRWSGSLIIGAIVGGGFCLSAWLLLRAAVPDAGHVLEIVFLQIALSTAGLFVFGVAALLARKWEIQKR